jgi:hypothetical protein
MSLFRRLRKRLPKSFYDKGNEILNHAEDIKDPETKTLALEAARKYYEADVSPKEPFAQTLLIVLVSYVVVFATAALAFSQLAFLTAVGVVIGSFVVLSFLVGAAMRASGYISESSFMGIFTAGLRALLLMRKQSKG